MYGVRRVRKRWKLIALERKEIIRIGYFLPHKKQFCQRKAACAKLHGVQIVRFKPA
jgi:hypothetical protein